MNSSIAEQLSTAFDDLQMEIQKENQLVIKAKKEAVLALLSFLKNRGFDHLTLISCVDWLAENSLELIYILSAYRQADENQNEDQKTNIILKTKISRTKPAFLSIIPVFENAEPYEREIHELYGIHFEGHPRLKPLFLDREYQTPPFRKDFDTREYVKKSFDRVPSIEPQKPSEN